MRRLCATSGPRRLATLTTMLAALVSVPIALAATDDPDAAGPSDAAPAKVETVSAEFVDNFAAFRGPQMPSDRPDVRTREVMDPGGAISAARGLNLDLSRALAPRGASHAWAVPGPDRLCLFVPDGDVGYGIACGSADEALAGRLMLALQPHADRQKGDAIRIVGLVPDDTAQVAVATNAAVVESRPHDGFFDITVRDLSTVSMTLSDGRQLVYLP